MSLETAIAVSSDIHFWKVFFEMRCASDRLHKEYITIGLVAE